MSIIDDTKAIADRLKEIKGTEPAQDGTDCGDVGQKIDWSKVWFKYTEKAQEAIGEQQIKGILDPKNLGNQYRKTAWEWFRDKRIAEGWPGFKI